MSDIGMAAGTYERFTAVVTQGIPLGKAGDRLSVYRFRQRCMTIATGPFSDGQVTAANLDRLMKGVRRKVEGVPETVVSFGDVLAYELGRCVTVVTYRDIAVARLDPTGILRLHDVAVGARRRIVREV